MIVVLLKYAVFVLYVDDHHQNKHELVISEGMHKLCEFASTRLVQYTNNSRPRGIHISHVRAPAHGAKWAWLEPRARVLYFFLVEITNMESSSSGESSSVSSSVYSRLCWTP